MATPFDFYDIKRIGFEHDVAFNENLSWWDTGSEYKTKIGKHLRPFLDLDCSDYRYSCCFNELCLLSKKLSRQDLVNSSETGICIFLNGSLALLNVIRCLKIYAKRKRLLIIGTPYFSVPLLCQSFGLDYCFFPVVSGSKLKISAKEILSSDCDCILFTNPLYCSGVALHSDNRSEVLKVIKSGRLCIFDECITPNGHELIRTLGSHKNTIYIYSPLKAIAINGIKFSAVISSASIRESIINDTDFFTGSLTISTISAIRFFLSKDFDAIIDIRREHIKHNLKALREVMATEAKLDFDSIFYTNYVFFQHPCNCDNVGRILRKICKKARCLVIPAQASGITLPPNHFGFRINLLLNSDYIKEKVTKIQTLLTYEVKPFRT